MSIDEAGILFKLRLSAQRTSLASTEELLTPPATGVSNLTQTDFFFLEFIWLSSHMGTRQLPNSVFVVLFERFVDNYQLSWEFSLKWAIWNVSLFVHLNNVIKFSTGSFPPVPQCLMAGEQRWQGKVLRIVMPAGLAWEKDGGLTSLISPSRSLTEQWPLCVDSP